MTASRKNPKEGTCSLCGGRYDDYGHNPAPLSDIEDRCCDACNQSRVIPARLYRMERSHHRFAHERE